MKSPGENCVCGVGVIGLPRSIGGPTVPLKGLPDINF